MDSLIKMNTGIQISQGKLLISEPLLQDENFHRSVIYLCYQTNKESLGFILNKYEGKMLNFFIEDSVNLDFPVYFGGPVETESLHFIHSVPEIAGGELIADNIYWSGDVEQIVEGMKTGKVNTSNCRFFTGYSGWSEGQIEAELDMNAWLVANSNSELVFETDIKTLWNESIKSLGKNYSTLLFMPDKPELN